MFLIIDRKSRICNENLFDGQVCCCQNNTNHNDRWNELIKDNGADAAIAGRRILSFDIHSQSNKHEQVSGGYDNFRHEEV